MRVVRFHIVPGKAFSGWRKLRRGENKIQSGACEGGGLGPAWRVAAPAKWDSAGAGQVYSLRKAMVWSAVISKGLRQRMFAQESLSSRRTI